MKTCDLKLGDIVHYKGNTGFYMDMTVVSIFDDEVVVWRPYIWMTQDGPELKTEKIVFSVEYSKMEWEVKSRRADLNANRDWYNCGHEVPKKAEISWCGIA
jgi:hypothetical protein